MRVLHVIESLGGGVLTSVLTMVDATPDIEHHLVVWNRRAHAHTGDGLAPFAAVHDLPAQPHRAARGLQELIARVTPEVVHAHSSYAGLLARSVEVVARVAYSPHCFAFERTDLGAVGRAAVREVERALVRRTDVLIACSPHEAGLAAELGHARVVTVPNRALRPPKLRARRAESFRVVTVGRVTAQKDWRHLVAVKREVDRLTVDLGIEPMIWEWLGSGDTEGERALEDAGVSVSGWLPREEVVARIGAAQAYVHTAAWEGAPVSILEASAVGLPLAVRAIPTLVSDGVPGLEGTVDGLAEHLLDLRDPLVWAREQRRSLRYAAEHATSVQRYRLNAAYLHVPSPQLPVAVGATAGRS